jgi:hypothetical protein
MPVSDERIPSCALKSTSWSPIQKSRAERGLVVKAARWKSTTSLPCRADACSCDHASG